MIILINVSHCYILTYHIGGRTAWSSTVLVSGQSIAARYWYDGQYVNNAKEDAAEVAVKYLSGNSPNSSQGRGAGW